MDPSSNPTAGNTGINLPPPTTPTSPPAPAAAVAPAQAPAPTSGAPFPQLSQVPAAAIQPLQAPQTAALPTTPTAQSPGAEDDDKIEKEWVNKVQRIVSRTQADPYLQSEQLTAVKADYMKQRYNKIIKIEK